jgi:hypothetical protein
MGPRGDQTPGTGVHETHKDTLNLPLARLEHHTTTTNHPEFPIWTSVSRIVRFPCPRHNARATSASPRKNSRGTDGSFFPRLTSPACHRVINFSDTAPNGTRSILNAFYHARRTEPGRGGGPTSGGCAHIPPVFFDGVLYVPPKRPYTLARAAVNGFGARWRGRLGLSLPVPFVRKISQAGHIPIIPFIRPKVRKTS